MPCESLLTFDSRTAGAVLLARVEAGEWPQTEFTAMMDKGLTRNEDRAPFGLPAIPETGKEQNP